MRKLMILVFAAIISVNAGAATKDSGKTTLKDVQPAGTTDKKHKHQQYDLSFTSSSGKGYTCRTDEKKGVKATDFVVGSDIAYEVKDNKGKVRSAGGKQVACTLVRIEQAPATSK